MGHPTWGMLPLAIVRVPFFCQGEKWLEATSGGDIWHILGPKHHLSTATLVGLVLAMAMDFRIVSVGPFGQIMLFSPF